MDIVDYGKRVTSGPKFLNSEKGGKSISSIVFYNLTHTHTHILIIYIYFLLPNGLYFSKLNIIYIYMYKCTFILMYANCKSWDLGVVDKNIYLVIS